MPDHFSAAVNTGGETGNPCWYICYHCSQSFNQQLYLMSYSLLMATFRATPSQGLARPSETPSLHSHCHVFCDLQHRATCMFTQPSSRQPATTRTPWLTAPKNAWDALTHLSHNAMAHRGHDEPPKNQSVLAMSTQAIQHLQIEELFQQPSYWDTKSPKGTRDAGLLVSTITRGLKIKRCDHNNGTLRCRSTGLMTPMDWWLLHTILQPGHHGAARPTRCWSIGFTTPMDWWSDSNTPLHN